MNTKKKTIFLTTLIVVGGAFFLLSSTLADFNTIELDRVNIKVYVDDISVSDVYKIPQSDYYFFIVWAGKRQEGYYIDFDKEIISLASDPKAKNIGRDKIKVRDVIGSGYNTESYLVSSFTVEDNETIVSVEDMSVSYNFDTRPLIFGKTLEFIFN
ncbi:MAG: hypothetical protein ACIAQZ_12810 [Sedimentisphaeraceae bacterium JB056]